MRVIVVTQRARRGRAGSTGKVVRGANRGVMQGRSGTPIKSMCRSWSGASIESRSRWLRMMGVGVGVRMRTGERGFPRVPHFLFGIRVRQKQVLSNRLKV